MRCPELYGSVIRDVCSHRANVIRSDTHHRVYYIYEKPEIFFSHYHNARCRLRTIFFLLLRILWYFIYRYYYYCAVSVFFFTPSDYPNHSFFPNIDTRVVGHMTINSSVFRIYIIYTYNLYVFFLFSLVFANQIHELRMIAVFVCLASWISHSI